MKPKFEDIKAGDKLKYVSQNYDIDLEVKDRSRTLIKSVIIGHRKGKGPIGSNFSSRKEWFNAAEISYLDEVKPQEQDYSHLDSLNYFRMKMGGRLV